MPIYKRCSRCGKRLLSGTKCGCSARRYDDDDHSDIYHQFYQSKEWSKARALAVARCGGLDWFEYVTVGRLVSGDTVHHIVPLKDDWSRRLDPKNLLYVTNRNHQLIHKALAAGGQERDRIMDLCLTALSLARGEGAGG